MSYYALETLNQYRYQWHLQHALSGTSYLLSLGAQRQQGENQIRWLSLASSLMDANVRVENMPSAQNTSQLSLQEMPDKSVGGFVIRQPLGDEGAQLVMEFSGLTEEILTASAFLLLNEIGRHPAEKRQQVFDEISQNFTFPLYRARQQQLVLDSRQLGRLQRGEPVVEWDKQYDRSLAINVYAPWSNTEDALVLGPIPFFDPYPNNIVVSFFLISLLTIAISVMLIIKHLVNRLYAIQDKVDAISPELEQDALRTNDADVIEHLNTKIQKMAKRIEKLVGEKSYMISAVSHDLRTPIAKLHFRLETLTALLGEENTTLDGCRSDLIQLNKLIDELLTYERLSVKQDVVLEPVNLLLLLQQEVDSMAMMFAHLDVSLSSSGLDKAWVDANDTLLIRLFDNLLNNAAKYATSKIVVSLSGTKHAFVVKVDDDGKGLDDKTAEKLFEPFFREDQARTHDGGGYGLGLAIVQKIAVQHHGAIEAGNNAMKGASFVFSIPKSTKVQLEKVEH